MIIMLSLKQSDLASEANEEHDACTKCLHLSSIIYHTCANTSSSARNESGPSWWGHMSLRVSTISLNGMTDCFRSGRVLSLNQEYSLLYHVDGETVRLGCRNDLRVARSGRVSWILVETHCHPLPIATHHGRTIRYRELFHRAHSQMFSITIMLCAGLL